MSLDNTKTDDVLMLAGVLPVIADVIEDNYGDKFKYNVKKKARELVEEIRKMDHHLMDGANIKLIEEQHRIGLSFRAWYKEHFKIEDDE